MLKIYIPNNNIEERKYIIEVLFNEFLGLKYLVIEENSSSNWKIILENGNELIIKDYFFNKFKSKLEYLNLENIPKKVKFAKNKFIVENDIPILYGNSICNIINETLIECNIDIFASSFFMLTRWEEYINKTRDKHNRFPAYESLAHKNNFLNRPIVNEYIEMLWNMLVYLGINQTRKKQKFKIIPTHDIDSPLRYPSLSQIIKEINNYIKQRKYKVALYELKEYFLIHIKLKKDPNDTFDYIMNLSQKVGLKSYFFFMGKGTSSKYDEDYSMSSPYIKKLVQKIINRGHGLGIHPSYFTFDNKEQLKKEKNIIESSINQKVKYGRQHYLRFEVPTTWQNLEDNNMLWDSSLSYADKEGFRCGVCYGYSVFNILNREKLNLKERPLIMMEVSFIVYQADKTTENIQNEIIKLIDKVKKFNGEFVFLWHNRLINKKDKEVFERIMNYFILKSN